MQTTAINLRELFGDRFVVARKGGEIRDSAWDAPHQFIPCRWGHIGPYGNKLVAATQSREVRATLQALPCVEVLGSQGSKARVAFPVAMFERVAELMKPERKAATGRQGLGSFMRKR